MVSTADSPENSEWLKSGFTLAGNAGKISVRGLQVISQMHAGIRLKHSSQNPLLFGKLTKAGALVVGGAALLLL